MVGECLEWQGSFSSTGYGIAHDKKGRLVGAHRMSWQTAFGPIPDGLCVLHKCDNRRCIRPDHLFLGTKRDNTADMIAKGRHRSGPPIYHDEAHRRAREATARSRARKKLKQP